MHIQTFLHAHTDLPPPVPTRYISLSPGNCIRCGARSFGQEADTKKRTGTRASAATPSPRHGGIGGRESDQHRTHAAQNIAATRAALSSSAPCPAHPLAIAPVPAPPVCASQPRRGSRRSAEAHHAAGELGVAPPSCVATRTAWRACSMLRVPLACPGPREGQCARVGKREERDGRGGKGQEGVGREPRGERLL